MLNPFALEKELFQKIIKIESIIDLIKKEISNTLIFKSSELQIELTQDLKEKCTNSLNSLSNKHYTCKICLKTFDDGRKLGGHVSRAHKDMISEVNVQDDIKSEVNSQDSERIIRRTKKIAKLSPRSRKAKSKIDCQVKLEDIVYQGCE